MYWRMHHGGWPVGWAVAATIFWVALLVLLVLLIARLARETRTAPRPPGPPPPPPYAGPDPERLLAERFARGEIDAQEYRDRLAVLRGDPAG